jgi:hypothetical protein
MQKRITITMNEAVFDDLVRVIGRRKISKFLEDLARPYVMQDDLPSAYQAMAADTEREREALAWSNALIGNAADAAR